jgi:hypothetical protein
MTSERKRPWLRRLCAGAAAAVVLGCAAAQAQVQPVGFDLPAPELAKGAWLNAPKEGLTIAGLKGKVTVLHFWTFG